MAEAEVAEEAAEAGVAVAVAAAAAGRHRPFRPSL